MAVVVGAGSGKAGIGQGREDSSRRGERTEVRRGCSMRNMSNGSQGKQYSRPILFLFLALLPDRRPANLTDHYTISLSVSPAHYFSFRHM